MRITIMPVGMLGTNCYLLETEQKNCAVVDPGAQAEKIIAQLRESKLTPCHILLTHGHHDHIGAVKKLMQTFPDCALHIGREDLELLRDAQKSLGLFRNNNIDDFLHDNAKTVAEGDVIALDELELRVLETPGHTKGGVTYLCGDAMFSGDTLFLDDVGRTDLYGGDYDMLLSSLRKLAELTGDYAVYPGHGGTTTLSYERGSNRYILEALR